MVTTRITGIVIQSRLDSLGYVSISEAKEHKKVKAKDYIMGVLGNFLVEFYSSTFDLSSKDASVFMIITLVFLGCFLTCLGFFDKWVGFAKCGLIIPITGFAHAMMSAALEYRKEGLVTGIGSNMFKLAGSVIIYGVVSAYIFGLLRLLIIGG